MIIRTHVYSVSKFLCLVFVLICLSAGVGMATGVDRTLTKNQLTSTGLSNTAILSQTIEKATVGGGGVPVGTIIAWPVATNPEGWSEGLWLECNGQAISQTVYPELWALVGASVPNLQGRFLRGTGGNAAANQTIRSRLLSWKI